MKQRILIGGTWLTIQNRQPSDEYGWFSCDLEDGVDKVRQMQVCQDMIEAIIDIEEEPPESAPPDNKKVKIAKPTVL